MTTKVPGQMGPHFTITEKSAHEALLAIMEKEGARNLVGELHRLMNKREVTDVAELFDAKTAGLVLGPAAVVRDMQEAAKWGQADNHTYHFAMTAIVYAMALEKLDPEFFKERKHSMPGDRDAYLAKRQEIMAYVRSIDPEKK